MSFHDELMAAAERVKEAAYDRAVDDYADSQVDASSVGGGNSNTTRSPHDSEIAEYEADIQESGEFDYIPERFRPFAKGEPEAYDAAIGHLDDCRVQVNGAKGSLDSTQGKLTDWEGAAANNFNDMFLAPFYNSAVENHLNVISELQAGLEKHREILVQGQRDIMDIAEQTEEALKTPAPKESVDNVSAVLGMVAIGLAVAAVPMASPGIPAALALLGAANTTASQVTSFAGEVEREEAAANAEQLISGTSAVEILDSMEEAMTVLAEQIVEKEEALQEALRESVDEVDRFLASDAEGELVDGEDGGYLTGEAVPEKYHMLPMRPDLANGIPDIGDMYIEGTR